MVEEADVGLYKIHPVVLQKYRDNDYLVNWLPNASEENEKNFWVMVNDAKKPVKKQITKIIRTKKGKTEHFFYHEQVRSENIVGSPIHFYHTVGKYEDPTFRKNYNEQTRKVQSIEIEYLETMYELEWPKDWNDDLESLVSDTADLVVIQRGRHYGGFDLDQFLTYTFDELVTYGKFGTLNPQMIKEIERQDSKIGKKR